MVLRPANRDLLAPLLLTQLRAADVYARFYSHSGKDEAALWKKMLRHELDHIHYLDILFTHELPVEDILPLIKVEKVVAVCERAIKEADISFRVRLEHALRLESAELDYGLEALAAHEVDKLHGSVPYPGRIEDHLRDLLIVARKYEADRGLGMLIARMEELFPRLARRRRSTTTKSAST